MMRRQRTLLAVACMSFACHVAATLAEGSGDVNSYLSNQSSLADDIWIATEESGGHYLQNGQHHHEVRSKKEPLIESKAALDTGTKHNSEDVRESADKENETLLRIQQDETDETEPRIQQEDPGKQTNDRIADDVVSEQNDLKGHGIPDESFDVRVASGISVKDEVDNPTEGAGDGRQFVSPVDQHTGIDKDFVSETGKISMDHVSVVSTAGLELDGDENSAEISGSSDDDGMSPSGEAELFSTSIETDDGVEGKNASEAESGEEKSNTSRHEASTVHNNLDHDNASTFHGDKETDGSTQGPEVNGTTSTRQSLSSVGPDESSDGENVFEADSMGEEGGAIHDIFSDDDKPITETRSLLNKDADVRSNAESGDNDVSTFDGEEKVSSSTQPEVSGTSTAEDVPTSTNASADESGETRAAWDAESEATSPMDDVAGESETESTHAEGVPAINETGSDKTSASAYVDDDVIDFDVIESNTDVPSAEAEEDSNGSVGRNHSDPAADEKTEAMSVDNDLEPFFSEQVTEGSIQHNPSKGSAPKKGSLAEFFKKVSKGDEQLSTSATTSPDTAASKKSVNVNMVARNEPVIKTMIPLPEEEKKASNLDERAVDDDDIDTPKYKGSWGYRQHSTPANSRVPDDALSQLLGYIKESEDNEGKYAPEAEKHAFPDEFGDAAETGDEKQSKDTVSDNITDDGENAAETGDEKQSKDSASEHIADDEHEAKVQKSVNTEFVDGLDDIDKFLEAVDPPDELDVGAAGSSIQEVLIGQSAQILIKRVKLGVHFVSKFVRRKVAKAKTKLNEFVARRTDEDGDFALVTRQEVEAAAEKVMRIGRRVLKGIQELLDDFFGDELDDDVLDLDFDLDKMHAKIVSLREKQVLPRPGNVAAMKENVDADADTLTRQRLH